MMYLGDIPIGLIHIFSEWVKLNSAKLEFNQYQSFDTAIAFFNDTYVLSIISQLQNGNYKIVFDNNTDNSRAGQWISFRMIGNTIDIDTILVMRVGLDSPKGSAYGVDVYDGAEGIIYISTKESDT